MHHTPLQNLPLGQMIILGIALLCVVSFYLLPTFMAIKRKSPHRTAVVIINFFLGFTLVGWIIALVLASKLPQPVLVVYDTPPPRP
jgi:RsiW-degrading membrane proteinase PrsW (M82 family)